MGVTYAYAADIVKTERDENGDLIVYGKATGPDLDLDGQICDPKWLKSAMPAWMEWGNVREMHQPIAAGVGIELVEQGDDFWLKSKCIDPGTVKKIEEGVLKGYSIGIKSPKVVKDAAAPGGRIVGGSVVETSYVDRPCNPTAKMAICKAASDGSLQPVEAADPDQGAVKAVDAELVKQAGDLAGEVRALVPDLDKAAPEQDIADAQAAIASIARLIVSEADGLAAGHLNEAYDIACLLDAVRALRYFIDCERFEESAGDVVALAAGPDLTKTAGTPPAAKTPDAPAPDNNTLADLVKSAVAEATAPLEERSKALEAELAKVRAAPVPGGPVLARPVQDLTKATTRSSLLEKAAQYDAQAVALRPVDHNAASGYTQKAAALRAQAAETL